MPLRLALLALAALLLARGAAAFDPKDKALFREDLYGDPQAVIATLDGEDVTEQDVDLWQTLFHGDPGVFEGWRTEEFRADPVKRRGLSNVVRSILAARLQAKVVADDFDTTATPEQRERVVRVVAARAARLVWAEEAVRPTIEVNPEDIALYARENSGRFSHPATVTVRRLRVPFEAPVTEESRAKARHRAVELRARAAISGGLLPILRETPAYQLDVPTDAKKEIRAGMKDVDLELEQVAFKLGVGQISEPIETNTGALLIETVSREDEVRLPFEEVRAKIEDELRLKFYPQQFEYALYKLAVTSRAVNRGALFPFVGGDVDIIRVGDFALTKDEFTWMFPEVVGRRERPSRLAIVAQAGEIIEGEIVTQDLYERFLDYDPRYVRGRELATIAIRAQAYLRREKAAINPTDAQVEAYLETHRDKLAPPYRRKIWEVRADVKDWEVLSEGELNSLVVTMRGHLEEVATVASRQLRERAAIAGDAAFKNPKAVVSRLPGPGDDRIRVRVSDLGNYDTRRASEELDLDLDGLPTGEFSAPDRRGNHAVVCYYAGEQKANKEPPADELRRRALEGVVAHLAGAGTNAQIDELSRSGRLKWNFEPGPAEE